MPTLVVGMLQPIAQYTRWPAGVQFVGRASSTGFEPVMEMKHRHSQDGCATLASQRFTPFQPEAVRSNEAGGGLATGSL